jgi:hypothetical protein
MLRAGFSKGCGCERIRYGILASSMTQPHLHQQQRRAMAAARRLLDRTTPAAAVMPTATTPLEARSIQAQASAASSSDPADLSSTHSPTGNSGRGNGRGNSGDSFKELYQVLKQQQDLDALRRRLQQQGHPVLPPTIESLRDQAAALMHEAAHSHHHAEFQRQQQQAQAAVASEGGEQSSSMSMMYGEANEMAFFLDEIEEDFYPVHSSSPSSPGSLPMQQQPQQHLIPNEHLSPVETEQERMHRLEIQFEQGTIAEALAEYKEVQDTLFNSGKAANLPVVKRQIFAWYVRLPFSFFCVIPTQCQPALFLLFIYICRFFPN